MHPTSHRSAGRRHEEPAVSALRGQARLVDRRLVLVNGVFFTVLVVLAGAAPGVLATEVVGRINVGLLLCLALGLLALCTSVGYDRRLAREWDPEADRLRTRHEERAAAEQAAAAQNAEARQYWGWESPTEHRGGEW
ncbi:DUF485 domain-containing protein [Streptacidiphilus jiangxiensis]|uniref:Uncharacterized membrane protein, DUF485 family n=1 Tax=Streptacidiphilus jiangxiensis TaxID=235985 RepID=A0A1H7YXE6_STRJI|nr:DUF485 domain-containing protein [Streptacidiphilus jiangxiensis]SEM50484.1 Uncharacterized membrane protein, DUF485 family [Streptacidiphilus jiangxiensis]